MDNSSQSKSGKLEWITPELNQIDVRRETQGGPLKGKPEDAVYRPS